MAELCWSNGRIVEVWPCRIQTSAARSRLARRRSPSESGRSWSTPAFSFQGGGCLLRRLKENVCDRMVAQVVVSGAWTHRRLVTEFSKTWPHRRQFVSSAVRKRSRPQSKMGEAGLSMSHAPSLEVWWRSKETRCACDWRVFKVSGSWGCQDVGSRDGQRQHRGAWEQPMGCARHPS